MDIKYRVGLDGPAVIYPKIHEDDRGRFIETYSEGDYYETLSTLFVQDNLSVSKKYVIRGLHFQKPPFVQAKLVRVSKGSILDVCVDLRKGSSFYGFCFSEFLSADNAKQFFIPEGFAHGFLSLEDDTIVEYKCSKPYNKESEGGILFDSKLSDGSVFPWNEIVNPSNFLISEKDYSWPLLETFDSPFEY